MAIYLSLANSDLLFTLRHPVSGYVWHAFHGSASVPLGASRLGRCSERIFWAGRSYGEKPPLGKSQGLTRLLLVKSSCHSRCVSRIEG